MGVAPIGGSLGAEAAARWRLGVGPPPDDEVPVEEAIEIVGEGASPPRPAPFLVPLPPRSGAGESGTEKVRGSEPRKLSSNARMERPRSAMFMISCMVLPYVSPLSP